jgi:hypothetical protein
MCPAGGAMKQRYAKNKSDSWMDLYKERIARRPKWSWARNSLTAPSFFIMNW